MGIEYPNITAPDQAAKLEQVRSYLFKLVDQLNYAMNFGASTGSSQQQIVRSGGHAAAEEKDDAQATFNSIKSLIIASSDVVNAYYDKIVKKLEGLYVAESAYGVYREQTEATITATSERIDTMFENIQYITTDIASVDNYLIDVKATIKAGKLYTDETGDPVYGLEVGQRNIVDGVETFNKYARFTSNRLSFYDKNDTEVAYISDYKLHITNAEVKETLTLGNYVLDAKNGLAFKWV